MHALRLVLSGLLGLCVYMGFLQTYWAKAIVLKAVGRDHGCSWEKLLKTPWHQDQFEQLRKQYGPKMQLLQKDSKFGIELWKTPGRNFWLSGSGELSKPKDLLVWVFAEQDWIDKVEPGHSVKPGDVVVDVGAHVGTFGDHALRLGASKVVMVEPDNTNLECLRRNFKDEIAAGKVVLVPFGAWSSEKTLEFFVAVSNSGTGSFVFEERGAKKVELPVKRLDTILAELGIDKVDFIKMDIEGAEREALQGARETLRKHKPKIMLDAYHLDDDGKVLPPIIKAANSAYREYCAACSMSRHVKSYEYVPYLIYFE